MVDGKLIEPPESEAYFADVSSCCNILYFDTNQLKYLKSLLLIFVVTGFVSDASEE
jgi:hypothetical protein